MSKDHFLKTWPDAFNALMDGSKTFEFRKNDRNFEVGDILILEEWHPILRKYSANKTWRKVSYVINGPTHGVPQGYCVMGFEAFKKTDHFYLSRLKKNGSWDTVWHGPIPEAGVRVIYTLGVLERDVEFLFERDRYNEGTRGIQNPPPEEAA